jgi:hypothetical protein
VRGGPSRSLRFCQSAPVSCGVGSRSLANPSSPGGPAAAPAYPQPAIARILSLLLACSPCCPGRPPRPPRTLGQRHGWALRDRASDANPLPIFRPGLAVACTGLSSGWHIGVSLSLAYICFVSGIGPWTTRAGPPSAVSNSFCFVSALDRYSSLPVRAPCSGKSRRVVAAAASVTIWATGVSP